MRVTGNMVNYYFVCPRKLWLFNEQLQFEDNSEKVAMGKLLDESSYGRDEKHVMIDNVVNVDMIQDWETVHEIKRSRAISKAAEWQLKYYIYYLRKKGIEIDKGILDYPLLKRRIEITYLPKDDVEMEDILKQIRIILKMSKAPQAELKSICRSCAYYEYCFI
ncbi:CRISPR-associated protein Cas4 [Limosilactobacillus caccae]|uniref:CRISPR-associated protein Cas4 n=1 Tax=Limosilactobacillus caccae TaxID=1926284 RepID=UPI0009702268|nr:CRISPR-associated protein Cas4 [Limosilactobacillus caccae]